MRFLGTPQHQNYKAVFGAAGVGMLLSTIWFYLGRAQLKHIGMIPADKPAGKMLAYVIAGCSGGCASGRSLDGRHGCADTGLGVRGALSLLWR